MTGLTISHDFDGLATYLRGASRETVKQADLAMFRGALTIERAAKTNAPKGITSNLTNSIHAKQVGTLHYEIGTGLQYAAAQELGTRPGYWPDISNPDFFRWVRKITGTGGREADRMAYLIGRAIYRKGTRAREFMKRAFDDNIDAVAGRITRAIGKGLEP